MIRPYISKDKEALISLIRLNTPQYFDKAEEQDLVSYLENELEDYFVIEQDNTVIGCGGINYEDNKKTAIISWDIIHPNYQGKGIGKSLLSFRINVIKENRTTNKIIVRTSQHTDKYYEKSGFKLEKIVKDYWAPGFDLYKMSINMTDEN